MSVLHRFRYYSPDEGMYISQDPIGLNGGHTFYSYVHDVNSWVDVFGLEGTCEDEEKKQNPKGARTEAADLQEQLAMEAAMAGAGEDYTGKLGDPKYTRNGGDYEKKQYNHDHGDGTSTEVHYDVNTKTGEGSGYKIKDDTNKNSRGHLYPALKTQE